MVHGLSCPWHVGSSRTRARTLVPCIGRWIPNHCTTREALIVVLICVFLMTNVEHLFICLFTTCISWWGVWSELLPILMGCLFSYCWIFKNALYILANVLYKYFLLVYSLSFHSLTVSFAERKFLMSIKYNLVIFYSMNHAFSVLSKNSSPNPRSNGDFLLFSSRSFIVLHFTVTYYFELILI